MEVFLLPSPLMLVFLKEEMGFEMSACLNTGFIPKPNTLVGFPFEADFAALFGCVFVWETTAGANPICTHSCKMYFKTKFSILYLNWEARHRV